jgi:hypothetical protein
MGGGNEERGYSYIKSIIKGVREGKKGWEPLLDDTGSMAEHFMAFLSHGHYIPVTSHNQNIVISFAISSYMSCKHILTSSICAENSSS